jgi:hypothetical protein
MEPTTSELEQLKYPIGKHQFAGSLSPQHMEQYLNDIAALPEKLKKEVAHLSAAQLDTPYRPGGWTVRQVVHHLGDSHMNAFIRFKLALTEDRPIIKPYMEAAWSDMEDNRHMAVETGLDLVTALHARWMVLLRGLSIAQLQRSYIHPEYKKEYSLEEAVSAYAWHSNHHLAHITELKKKNNWK